MRRAVSIMIFAAILCLGLSVAVVRTENLSPEKKFALRLDAALDAMDKPSFTASDLYPYWAFEIAPYFNYEGLYEGEVPVPELEPFIGADGMSHIHLGGYTYCAQTVWVNIRYFNWVSVKIDDIQALSIFVHEMVHTLGGSFCSDDSQEAESRTQLGTLETLAAMANHGNRVALWALLDELRDITMGTIWSQAREVKDEQSYLDFAKVIYAGEPLEIARTEKAARHWSHDPDTLDEILEKYEKSVYEDFQDFSFKADIEGDFAIGIEIKIPMDDLKYVLENLEEMVQ